jgi:hypothetical protein
MPRAVAEESPQSPRLLCGNGKEEKHDFIRTQNTPPENRRPR